MSKKPSVAKAVRNARRVTDVVCMNSTASGPRAQADWWGLLGLECHRQVIIASGNLVSHFPMPAVESRYSSSDLLIFHRLSRRPIDCEAGMEGLVKSRVTA